ncbi:MAG: ModD protein [Beijerinckiaceae bacterium]|nr:ModD protein [Beijerinckiaceae bacterium]
MRGDPLASERLRLTDADIERLAEEDLRFGDLTTRALGIGGKPGRMTFRARQSLVLCGASEAARILHRLGVTISHAGQTGEFFAEGALLLEATGSAAALHGGWKIAQTLMEWASGIATETNEIVRAARAVAPDIGVFCTRKSVPFTRQLSLKAILAGGAEVHRLGLSDTVMLFPEHRVFLENPIDLKLAVARLRRHVPERSVMIEVTSVEDAVAAAEAFADVIQLEKFAPDAARRVIDSIRKREDGRPVIAAAGGITARNAAAFAATGVDALVTSSPFQARPLDIKVLIEAV